VQRAPRHIHRLFAAPRGGHTLQRVLLHGSAGGHGGQRT